jgi:hypothetical protein
MTALSKNAGVAGFLYNGGSLVAVVRLIYIPNTLIVSENATATVNNIARHELLFRFGIFSRLLTGALWIFVTLALYRLFKGVDRGLAVLMVILGSLMQVPIFFVNSVNDAAALLFVRDTDFLSLFDKPQRDAFAMLFLNLHHYGDLANEIFWGYGSCHSGCWCTNRASWPRVLGVWLMIACFGYLASSITGLLLPAYEDKVINSTQPALLAEVAIMLWLTIMGAKERHLAAAS